MTVHEGARAESSFARAQDRASPLQRQKRRELSALKIGASDCSKAASKEGVSAARVIPGQGKKAGSCFFSRAAVWRSNLDGEMGVGRVARLGEILN